MTPQEELELATVQKGKLIDEVAEEKAAHQTTLVWALLAAINRQCYQSQCLFIILQHANSAATYTMV